VVSLTKLEQRLQYREIEFRQGVHKYRQKQKQQDIHDGFYERFYKAKWYGVNHVKNIFTH
jgi:hypothetical protein